MDIFSVPGVKELDQALGKVLPTNGGDPRNLARAALDVCLSENWRDDDLFVKAIDCASRFWAGRSSKAEAWATWCEVYDRCKAVKEEVGDESEMWCKLAVLSRSLDETNPSNVIDGCYLLEYGIIAGASVDTMRRAFERHVPGFLAGLPQDSGPIDQAIVYARKPALWRRVVRSVRTWIDRGLGRLDS
jgi:hypothetical protein